MSHKRPIPYRTRDISDLERMSDRSYAHGMALSIDAQLETGETPDPKLCLVAAQNMRDQLYKILDQCFFLEQQLDAYKSSINAERSLNLKITIENRTLTERNASMAKENRNLKNNIAEYLEKS